MHLTAASGDGRIETRSIALPVHAVDPIAIGSAPPVLLLPVTTFTQSIPAATWIVQHNLNRFPNVVVIDATGDEVEMDG